MIVARALLVSLLVSPFASGCDSAPAATKEGEARVVGVRASRPTVRELAVRLPYTAEIQPIQNADIKSIEARGFIRQIRVDKGDRVRKGQVLVVVDCPDYRSRRRQAEEEVRSAGAVHQNTQRIHDRLRPMREQNFISQTELDTARANYDAASARLKNAEARVAEVTELVGYCTMHAPFAGEVAARYRDPGHQVRPGGSAILTLMRIDAVRVWVNVVERDAAYVKEGIEAELTVPGLPGQLFKGKVSRFVRGFDPRTRTLLTEVEIENPEGLLKPGMFGRVSLIVERRPGTILVPTSAVLTQECENQDRAQCSWVYVVRKDCKAQSGECTRRIEVTVGFRDGDDIEIRKGVSKDDLIVTTGRDLVADETPVRILK